MHIIYDIKSKIASELAGFGFDSSSWQLNLSTAQNVFSKFRPGWWQFCWMTGVKFNSIQSILVRFLHITQFTACAAKNLTVFVADSPRCLEWSSMVVAVSRALRELSEPCLGWTREPRRQPKSLGARRQYSQATGNNVLPVMTGSPAFLTQPPPEDSLWARFNSKTLTVEEFIVSFFVFLMLYTPEVILATRWIVGKRFVAVVTIIFPSHILF